MVPSVAEVLLAHGAEVNKVAKGQSPLSLAIINGHDSVSILRSPHSIHNCLVIPKPSCLQFLIAYHTVSDQKLEVGKAW